MGDSGEFRSRSRRFERARPGKDPRAAVDRGVIGRLADGDSSVVGSHESKFRGGPSAYQLVGVAREVVREEQVEAPDHGSEREPDRHHNGDEETAADAPRKRGAAHPSV